MAVVDADVSSGGGSVNLTLVFEARISLNNGDGEVTEGVGL